ncbi:MAG: Zn-ribbon domain-containing OB-fold protein [Myxococcales bacterium]|nr:MAG: Zn-ribbon domain-containing OB-fold protein [Myxococcales bacterium]
MIDPVARPRPRPTEWSEGFWQGCARGELVIQRCDECLRLRHYPQPLCPHCRGAQASWQPVSGRGEIYSYAVCHRAFHPAFADALPYVVATVELEEGVRMVTDLAGVDPGELRIGMPVQVCFERVDDELVLPRFRLLR